LKEQPSKELVGEVLSQLKHQKFEARIVSVKYLNDLQKAIERHHKQGLFNDEFYGEWITEFDFSLPENLPNAKSLIVVAAPQPQFRVAFDWNGESHSFIIPPNYWCYSDRQVDNMLSRILGRKKHAMTNNSLPKRLIAVRSGSAK
jgi:epoxyqueuosine reductase